MSGYNLEIESNKGDGIFANDVHYTVSMEACDEKQVELIFSFQSCKSFTQLYDVYQWKELNFKERG